MKIIIVIIKLEHKIILIIIIWVIKYNLIDGVIVIWSNYLHNNNIFNQLSSHRIII